MIGAAIARRMAGSAFDAVNQHDLAKFAQGLREDVTLTFPGHLSVSGEFRGKEACVLG